MISIRLLQGDTFEVRIEGELIEASFLFLLEREPNTSIMEHFDLTIIGRFFPEWEEAMREAAREG